MESGNGQADAPARPSAPYISYLTFANCLDWLSAEGVPARLDRSIWSKRYSGSVGPQLLLALRFLGLLRDEEPTPQLEELVEASADKRKELLVGIFRRSYDGVNFDLLNKATPNMVSEWVGTHGVAGETLRKAVSFLINGLKAVEFPLSPALVRAARNRPSVGGSGTSRTKGKGAKPPKGGGKEEPAKEKVDTSPPPTPPTNANTRSVALASGGVLTLSFDVDLFGLSAYDRKFVLALVDKVKEYNPESATATPDAPDESEGA
jgi:hypothetical protein